MNTVKTFQAAFKPIRKQFYSLLVSQAGCGPFDGACVVCAEALQQAFGGQVMVLTRANDVADHAVLLLNGKLWDMDGPLSPARLLARFNRVELIGSAWKCTAYRPIQDGDLPDAYRNPDLTAKLADFLRSIAR